MMDTATKADTLVVVTLTEGDDDFIYYNVPPARLQPGLAK